MTRSLGVFHRTRSVGLLTQKEEGLSFEYSREWLDADDTFAISVSLPLLERLDSKNARNFFANLLPEASVRAALCRRLGISEGNDFALLEAIGGECAGALTILPDGTSPKERAAEYEPLSPAQLRELAQAHSALPAVDGRDNVRLSLAGAQDKLPVLDDGGRFFLPLGSSPSTHILKFPNQHFKHLPANEVLVAALARELDLPTVPTRWERIGREGLCVVERYDRVRREDGIERLHQEDLCQALAIPPFAKYEQEGGPSFMRCVDVIRAYSYDPVTDISAVLRWQAFNVIAGNADGHAKNLSLLWDDGWRLAPLYDLVCTRAYEKIDRRLAMAVGGESDPDRLRRPQIEACSREVEVKAAWLVETFRSTADAVLGALPRAIETSGVARSPVRERIEPLIKKQARRILRELGAPR